MRMGHLRRKRACANGAVGGTRIFRTIWVSLLLAGAPPIFAAGPAYILEIKKTTPLFDRPSLKGQRVAEAEAGTNLLFVEKSKQGFWVKVKDSSGDSGWIPKDRTDYSEIDMANSTLSKAQALETGDNDEGKKSPSKKKKAQENSESEVHGPPNYQDPFLRIAPLYRWLNKTPPASPRLGMRVDFNLGATQLANARAGLTFAALEATFPSPRVGGASDFTAAARYGLKAPLWGPVFYGIDLGISTEKIESKFRNHFSLGVSGGLGFGPLDITTRLGYDFFAQARAMAEVQIGCSF